MTDVLDGATQHALHVWQAQKRRVWLGRDSGGHVDGWAPRTVLAKVLEEREGAGSSRVSQSWPEVYTGDGLLVQRAIQALHEKPYLVLHLAYLFVGPQYVPVKTRCDYYRQVTGDTLSLAAYWAELRVAEQGVRSFLAAQDRLDKKDAVFSLITLAPVRENS